MIWLKNIQERAIRFVLRDQVSSYDVLLEKAGYESFRIRAVELLLVEMFKILMDYHLNICQIYSRNQTILIVWWIRINWFNHWNVRRRMDYGPLNIMVRMCGICCLCTSKVVNPFQNSKIVWNAGRDRNVHVYSSALIDVYRAPSFMHMFFIACVRRLCWNAVYSVYSFI